NPVFSGTGHVPGKWELHIVADHVEGEETIQVSRAVDGSEPVYQPLLLETDLRLDRRGVARKRGAHRNHLLPRSCVVSTSGFQFLTYRKRPSRVAIRSE